MVDAGILRPFSQKTLHSLQKKHENKNNKSGEGDSHASKFEQIWELGPGGPYVIWGGEWRAWDLGEEPML